MNTSPYNVLFYTLLITGFVLISIVLANPYRLRWRTKNMADSLLPEDVRAQMREIAVRDAGTIRLSSFQSHMLSIGGALIGVVGGIILYLLIGNFGGLLGIVLIFVGYMYPRTKYINGYSKSMLDGLERESVILANHFLQAVGMAGMSVQVAFERFISLYPDTQTAKLIAHISPGVSIVEFLASMDLPNKEVESWLEVINTLSTIADMGNRQDVLTNLRNRVRTSAERRIAKIIKQKVIFGPLANVALLLVALLSVLIGPIVLFAIESLSGSSIF